LLLGSILKLVLEERAPSSGGVLSAVLANVLRVTFGHAGSAQAA
jgi:hypothetical protein